MFLSDIDTTPGMENFRMEMKARLDRKNPEGWLKTVAGFANFRGGVLYIGVEDKSMKLIGFTKGEADSERIFFCNKVQEHIIPAPRMMFTFIPYVIREQERVIIKVSVLESDLKPVIYRYNGVPSIYMRRDGYTNGATPEEIREMCISSEANPFDTGRTVIPYDRNDFSELLETYSRNNDGRELTDKALKSSGFIDSYGHISRGATLFRDDYDGNETLMKLFLFPGMNRGANSPVSTDEFRGNLLSSIQVACNFISRNMNRTFRKLDDRRVDFEAYPSRAVFEGVVNAVAHRDYWLDGTQIQINMFKNRLEISSPGSFYRGGSLGRSYDLSGIISNRRNNLISEMLVKCKMMEASGTGFDKILEEYQMADEKHKPYIETSTDHFTLVLPDLTYGPGVEDIDLPDIEFIPPIKGSEHDELILRYCYRSWRTVAEIASFIGVSDSSYFRRNVLAVLVGSGLLEERIVGRTKEYIADRHNVYSIS